MSWPTGSIPTTHVDATGDVPADARPDFKSLIDAVNAMIAMGDPFALRGRLIAVRKLTGAGTYTPSAGTTSILVEMCGGGAQASFLPATTSSQIGVSVAGQSGAFLRAYCTNLSYFSGQPYSCGAGGNTGGTSGTPDGQAGGATTFGASGSRISVAGGLATPAKTAYANTFAGLLVPQGSYTIPAVDSGIYSSVLQLDAMPTTPIDIVRLNYSGFYDVPQPISTRFPNLSARSFGHTSTPGLYVGPTYVGSQDTGLGASGKLNVNQAQSGQLGAYGWNGSITVFEFA